MYISTKILTPYFQIRSQSRKYNNDGKIVVRLNIIYFLINMPIENNNSIRN